MNETGEKPSETNESGKNKWGYIPHPLQYPDFLEGINLQDKEKVVDVLSSMEHSLTSLDLMEEYVIENITGGEEKYKQFREEHYKDLAQEVYSQDPDNPGELLKLRNVMSDKEPFYKIAKQVGNLTEKAFYLNRNLQDIRSVVGNLGLMPSGDMDVTREDAMSFLIIKKLTNPDGRGEEAEDNMLKQYIEKRSLDKKDKLAVGYQEVINDIDNFFEVVNFESQLKHETEGPDVEKLDSLEFEQVKRGEAYIFETKNDIYTLIIQGIRKVPLRHRPKERCLITEIEMARNGKVQKITAKIPESDFKLNMSQGNGSFSADTQLPQKKDWGWDPEKFKDITGVYKIKKS